MKQNVTKADVQNIAISQIDLNGQTTTLEIKKEARAKDLWAKQDEISGLVSDLVNEGVLEVIGDNGIHRFYNKGVNATATAVADPSASAPTTQVTPAPVVATTPAHVVKHKNGTSQSVKALTANLVKKGDWEISSTADTQVLYFLGKLTRDEARGAYRSITGVKFTTTRSKRVA